MIENPVNPQNPRSIFSSQKSNRTRMTQIWRIPVDKIKNQRIETREMKITIEIPEALFRQAKARAALEGLSLREMVLRGLQLALKTPLPETVGTRVRFPLISASPDAPRLTSEQVYQALDSDKDLL